MILNQSVNRTLEDVSNLDSAFCCNFLKLPAEYITYGSNHIHRIFVIVIAINIPCDEILESALEQVLHVFRLAIFLDEIGELGKEPVRRRLLVNPVYYLEVIQVIFFLESLLYVCREQTLYEIGQKPYRKE